MWKQWINIILGALLILFTYQYWIAKTSPDTVCITHGPSQLCDPLSAWIAGQYSLRFAIVGFLIFIFAIWSGLKRN